MEKENALWYQFQTQQQERQVDQGVQKWMCSFKFFSVFVEILVLSYHRFSSPHHVFNLS